MVGMTTHNGHDPATLRQAVKIKAKKNRGKRGRSARKFSDEEIQRLRTEYLTQDLTHKQLAERYGCSEPTIAAALNGTHHYKGK